MRHVFNITLVCIFAGSAIGCATPLMLSPTSYGEVRFGSRLDDVEAKLKERAVLADRNTSCAYASFKQYPEVRFMIEQGIVTRAEVGPAVPNSAGINSGTSTATAKQMQPDIVASPHKYEADGSYLTLSTPDRKAALVFEADKSRITKVRAGLQPSVSYVEGCS